MKSNSELRIKRMLFLEIIIKWFAIISFMIMAYCWYYKDVLPPQSFYKQALLKDPIQTKTTHSPFSIKTHEQEYLITPLFDYELDGVIVTYNNAEQFGNIWHTKRWKDFINLRDLCVIWGNNVDTGIYKDIHFSSDSWTCWVTPKSNMAWRKFSMLQLSNNHVLVNSEGIRKQLMATEKGDQIQFKGMLVNYENKNSNFKRGSSVRRDDTGNGACETVYLTSFKIIKKANKGLRQTYAVSKNIFIFCIIIFFILMCCTPKRKRIRGR